MRSQTVFVLRAKEYSERDLLVYALTEDGLRNFVAKGVRRITSSFASKLSGFGFVECGAVPRRSGLDYIVEVKKSFLTFPSRENVQLISSLSKILMKVPVERDEFGIFYNLWQQNYQNDIRNLAFWCTLFFKKTQPCLFGQYYDSTLLESPEILLEESYKFDQRTLNFIINIPRKIALNS
jgi:recombinational DNA repair protein (RecF pathway)